MDDWCIPLSACFYTDCEARILLQRAVQPQQRTIHHKQISAIKCVSSAKVGLRVLSQQKYSKCNIHFGLSKRRLQFQVASIIKEIIQ